MGCKYSDCECRSEWCLNENNKENCVHYLKRENEEIRQNSVCHSIYMELLNENNSLRNEVEELKDERLCNSRYFHIPYELFDKVQMKYPSLRVCQLLNLAAEAAGWGNEDLLDCPNYVVTNGFEAISK